MRRRVAMEWEAFFYFFPSQIWLESIDRGRRVMKIWKRRGGTRGMRAGGVGGGEKVEGGREALRVRMEKAIKQMQPGGRGEGHRGTTTTTTTE